MADRLNHNRRCYRIKFFILPLIVILLIDFSFANKRSLAGYGGVLDRMGAGVAEMGSGNTGTARNNANVLSYWNPSLLAFLRKKESGMGSDIRSLNRNGGYAFFQGKVAPNLGAGLSILNRGDYDLPVWDADENFLGTARPQEFSFHLGLGLKTSRKNAYGIGIQWYQSNFDLSGIADKNVIGILNFGWTRSWTKKFITSISLRNLGINKNLSADYEFNSLPGENVNDLDQTGRDFLPKTFVAAVKYSFLIKEKKLDTYFEFMDFQLDRSFFDIDLDHHAMGVKLGAEWWWQKGLVLRSGYDRGNISLGMGYTLKVGRGKKMIFDYAVITERHVYSFQPYGIGIRYLF